MFEAMGVNRLRRTAGWEWIPRKPLQLRRGGQIKEHPKEKESWEQDLEMNNPRKPKEWSFTKAATPAATSGNIRKTRKILRRCRLKGNVF